ncbi:hypothetical protein PCASD_21511 [Puccinia coronata f. sp. avenae]|uniref:PFU domain-containing protein n=1 Tax=Puccinia coronata f. sp. avenae TaxID=200324 RepID=A0A2N5S7I7_9BASI|nr:hypothetical protein PCASD_21511 [Puccinia coronata f. sp. avenae]
MIRVFTRTDERLASSSELSQFEESVKASSVPSATVGDVKKSDLPTVAVLLSRRGKKEGEVAMAKNESNGAVEAYQWDGMKGDWSMLGRLSMVLALQGNNFSKAKNTTTSLMSTSRMATSSQAPLQRIW